jgi:hypothetical protein
MPNSQQYSRGLMTLNGFYYLSIEPPDDDHLFYPRRGGIAVDGHPEDSQFPPLGHIRDAIPASAFCCRFYVHDWNSFIHVAAEDCQLAWVEKENQA